MNQVADHSKEYTKNQDDLYLAIELGKKAWKLGFMVGFAQKPRAVWPGPYTLTGCFDRCPKLHEEPCHYSVPLEISQGRQVTGRRLSRAVGFICPTGGFPPCGSTKLARVGRIKETAPIPKIRAVEG